MITKPLLALALNAFLAITFLFTPPAHAADAGKKFKGPIGLQLYSLRSQCAKNVTATLDEVRKFGIKYLELAGTYGLTPKKFKTELDAHGLKAVSAHFSYESFRDYPETVARQAKELGLKYAGCAWIPHTGDFNEKTCREAAAVFNHAGEVLAKHGLKFFYHVHGYEFQPYKDGTLLDLLMAETKPEFANFEMDVFWIVFPGQDPVKLLEKYPSRWILMHVKGMRASTPTGSLAGGTDVRNDVAVGSGKIDYPPILKTAERVGVKWFFIEDESPSSEEQIPQSVHYLENLKW